MCLCLGRALISHSQMPRCWSCAKFVLCNLCILLMGPVWLVFFVVFKFWLSVIAKMQIILFVFSINHISFSQKMVILQFVSIPFLMQQTLLYGNLREVWVGNPAPEDWYKLCWGVQSYSERAGVGTGFRSEPQRSLRKVKLNWWNQVCAWLEYEPVRTTALCGYDWTPWSKDLTTTLPKIDL